MFKNINNGFADLLHAKRTTMTALEVMDVSVFDSDFLNMDDNGEALSVLKAKN